MNQYIKNQFLKLMKSAFIAAESAHRLVFTDTETDTQKNRNLVAAHSYFALSVAKSSAAKALYVSRIDELDHQELDDLFYRFDALANEFYKDYSTNHNYQWVDIEFSKLKESFEDSVCSLPIVE